MRTATRPSILAETAEYSILSTSHATSLEARHTVEAVEPPSCMMATGGGVVHFEFTECLSAVVDLRRSLIFNDFSERFKC